jgi:hypothetical protein
MKRAWFAAKTKRAKKLTRTTRPYKRKGKKVKGKRIVANNTASDNA